MANRKGKMPAHIGGRPQVMRQVSLGTGISAVIASENPVERYDSEHRCVVREVLLMSGVEMRANHSQLPIVDSHDDKTVRNIFGSIRNIRVEGDKLIGDTFFASDPDAQQVATRMAEGHITDFSISADVLESQFIPVGQQYHLPSGDLLAGPAVIVTRWSPYNASICATGADEYSVVRRSYTTDLTKGVERMDEALLSQLSALGLPDGMVDPNQILAWVVGKLSGGEAEEQGEGEAMPISEPMAEPAPVEMMSGSDMEAKRQADTEAAIRRALEADQKRRSEIQAACKLAKVERAFADQLCDAGVSVEAANKRIIERMATQPIGTSVGADVRVTASSDDKFHNAVLDGLVMRSAKGAGIKRSLFLGGDKPSEGAQDFSRLNLKRIAHACLERSGLPVSRMSDVEIAQAAMGNANVLRRYKVERADFNAYHTTGSFSNILLDAANKTLLAAYEEAPYTWQMWARQGTSAEDFKTLYRTRFSEAPNPEEVPEGHDYPEKAMSDSKESYRVAKYGESFSVSWETVVNDDLDALSRVPAMHGNAMRRLQNKKVYEVLTSNPTMGDGYSLFSSSHASGDNTSGAAAAPSVTTLNAGFVKMMTQKGLSSDAVLNIIPRFLIVPVAYSATALELVSSTSYAASNNNQGVTNIYGPTGSRPLTVVVDPQLDANSSTKWYLAADPAQIDTVELTFLSGEESPVMESEWNIKNDTYLYKIRQTFGVKAIDWRGLYLNAA